MTRPHTPQLKTPQLQGTSTEGFRTKIRIAFRGEFALHVQPHPQTAGGAVREKVEP